MKKIVFGLHTAYLRITQRRYKGIKLIYTRPCYEKQTGEEQSCIYKCSGHVMASITMVWGLRKTVLELDR